MERGGIVTVRFDGRVSAMGGLCYLRLTLLNQPYADAEDSWDRELIRCEVSVRADVFI